MSLLWLKHVEEHDYLAAYDYLELMLTSIAARKLVAIMPEAPITQKKVKDILRASDLEILPYDDPHVAIDLKKIGKSKPLSPVLLVRGNLAGCRALEVADGYHRLCAVYHSDEEAEVPCKIVDLSVAFSATRGSPAEPLLPPPGP